MVSDLEKRLALIEVRLADIEKLCRQPSQPSQPSPSEVIPADGSTIARWLEEDDFLELDFTPDTVEDATSDTILTQVGQYWPILAGVGVGCLVFLCVGLGLGLFFCLRGKKPLDAEKGEVNEMKSKAPGQDQVEGAQQQKDRQQRDLPTPPASPPPSPSPDLRERLADELRRRLQVDVARRRAEAAKASFLGVPPPTPI